MRKRRIYKAHPVADGGLRSHLRACPALRAGLVPSVPHLRSGFRRRTEVSELWRTSLYACAAVAYRRRRIAPHLWIVKDSELVEEGFRKPVPVIYTGDPTSRRRPPLKVRDLRLALLLTFGSVNTWCENFPCPKQSRSGTPQATCHAWHTHPG